MLLNEKIKKLIFLGGDARQKIAAQSFIDEGYSVECVFCDEQEAGATLDLEGTLFGAEIVVLPLPSSTDGVTLNAPLWKGEGVKLSQIVEALSSATLLIGGRIPESAVVSAQEKGVRVIDYFKSEAFQIENAYTTSEAALSIAMNNMKKNVRGATFAVTGYGRIARTLTELLIKLGADVSVLARKESDLAWARLAGANTKRLDERSISSLAKGYDIIFNTVPTWLFFEDFLLRLDKGTLIIDLASSPGGVDVSAAKKLSSNVLWASSLPGKYAPESAGRLIGDCIKNIISEACI